MPLTVEDIFNTDFKSLKRSDLRPLSSDEFQRFVKRTESDANFNEKFQAAVESVNKFQKSVVQNNEVNSSARYKGIDPYLYNQYLIRKLLNESPLLPLPEEKETVIQGTKLVNYNPERDSNGYLLSYADGSKNKTKRLEVDIVAERYNHGKYKYVLDTDFKEFVDDEDESENILNSEIDKLREQLAEVGGQAKALNSIRNIESREAARTKKALEEANAALGSLANSMNEQQKEVADKIQETINENASKLEETIDELIARIEDNESTQAEQDELIASLTGQLEVLSANNTEQDEKLAKALEKLSGTLTSNANNSSKLNKDLLDKIKEITSQEVRVNVTSNTTSTSTSRGTSTSGLGDGSRGAVSKFTNKYQVGDSIVSFSLEGPKVDETKLGTTAADSQKAQTVIKSTVSNKSEIESAKTLRDKIASHKKYWSSQRDTYQGRRSAYKSDDYNWYRNNVNKIMLELDSIAKGLSRKIPSTTRFNPNLPGGNLSNSNSISINTSLLNNKTNLTANPNSSGNFNLGGGTGNNSLGDKPKYVPPRRGKPAFGNQFSNTLDD